MEKSIGIFTYNGKKFSTVWNTREPQHPRQGAALIVSLWTVLILSLLIGGLAYEMHVEAGITSYARKRLKAQVAARGGVEYAKFLIAKSLNTSAFPPDDDEEKEFLTQAKLLERGNKVGVEVKMGISMAKVEIKPEASRNNPLAFQDENWEELLARAGVPEEKWPDLIDCYMDFIDENDEHRLNGAEKEDQFYKEKGYDPKNAPLDIVDELILIKGFTPEIVYGGPPADPKGEPLRGIAHLLTTFGDGKLNVNTAESDALESLVCNGKMMDDWVIADVLKYRMGDDGIEGTKDDGFTSVQEAISKTGMDPALAACISVGGPQSVQQFKVVSIGENNGVKSGVWAVFEVGDKKVTPIYWREEQMQ
jgi:general secretion pathway protein K